MKTISTHAEAAKMIRKELKNEFPTVKFSVTSRSYSGGNSINVDWINGPCSDKVMTIIKKYQYGHFDGMYDCYENSNSRNDIPQVKYVFGRREVSEEIKNRFFENCKKTYNGWENLKDINETSQELMDNWGVWTASNYIYRLWVNEDFYEAIA